jgi:hypothetical protein
MWGEVGPTAHLICLLMELRPAPFRGGQYSCSNGPRRQLCCLRCYMGLVSNNREIVGHRHREGARWECVSVPLKMRV